MTGVQIANWVGIWYVTWHEHYMMKTELNHEYESGWNMDWDRIRSRSIFDFFSTHFWVSSPIGQLSLHRLHSLIVMSLNLISNFVTNKIKDS